MNNLLFLILAALLEVGGCWQWYQYLIKHQSPLRAVTGTITLIAFGWAVSQPSLPAASYIYAAYAGIYAAVAILFWMPIVDGESPTLRVVIGACLYLIGSIIILWPYFKGTIH